MPARSGPARPGALLALVLAAAAGAAGCARHPDETPRPAAMEPAGGPALLPTAVTIRGDGFLARASQTSSGGASLDAGHRAWVGGVELPGVVWVDAHTLRATVPAGLAFGVHDLVVENALGERGGLSGAWSAGVSASLALQAALDRAQASVGQPVVLTAAVRNTGVLAVRDVVVAVSPSAPVVSGSLTAAPLRLDPGAAATVLFSLSAAASGTATLALAAAGTEEATGGAVVAAAAGPSLRVQARAALAGDLAIPSVVAAGATFQAILTVHNVGEATALGVAPGPLGAAPDATGAVTVLAGPTPASADLAAGAGASFTFDVKLLGTGTVRLRGSAAGVDGNDGGAAATGALDSNLADQHPEVAPVSGDVLGDGTAIGALAAHGGHLYAGPSDDGARFLRLDPATGTSALPGVRVGVDLGATKSDNSAWRAAPPATTFGARGCTPSTLACGPSNERGVDVLAAGPFAGAERLLAAGASGVGPRFLYLADLDASPLPFSPVDLRDFVPSDATAISALAFAPGAGLGSDRLYAAFTDSATHKGPLLVALAEPVLVATDATAANAWDLAAASLDGLGGNALRPSPDATPRIEAMAWFGDRLLLAGGGTLVRSTVDLPRAADAFPSDWIDATPVTTAWTARTPLPGSGLARATPADRAVPATAAFPGCGGACLYLARNVQGSTPGVVPQLWRCDPTRTGDPAACDPGDWSLAAPNPTGEGDLSQVGAATNGALSLLVATPRYLYVGFDDAATGVQLYRAEAAPVAAADFHGRNGCAPRAPGCTGLGGNGLGSPSVTRVFDARPVTAGGRTTLYVLAGDGAGPLRLFALPE